MKWLTNEKEGPRMLALSEYEVTNLAKIMRRARKVIEQKHAKHMKEHEHDRASYRKWSVMMAYDEMLFFMELIIRESEKLETPPPAECLDCTRCKHFRVRTTTGEDSCNEASLLKSTTECNKFEQDNEQTE